MTDLSEHVRKQAAAISTTSHFETKMFFHAAKVLEQDEDIRLTQIRYIKILQKSIVDLKQELRDNMFEVAGMKQLKEKLKVFLSD